MAENWNNGYFIDSSYTFGYYRELSPQFLKLCLLLQGILPPEGKNYCELGFGNGVSINVHASSGTHSYYGTDFTPRHTAFAQRYAQATEHTGQLYNLSFKDFANLPHLPQFDIITLHGVWSWIRPEIQEDIINFIEQKLNPGGIVYISYNALPGWSTQQPLQKLLKLYDTHINRKIEVEERVKDAFAFAKQVVSMPSLLSAALPNIKIYCDKHTETSSHYLAHEFLNDTLNPSYFEEITHQMQKAKCDFACTATPQMRIQDIHFTHEQKDFLNSIEHPLLKEQLQDFIIFEKFRRDVYGRGTTLLTIAERWLLLSACRLTLAVPLSAIELQITGHIGTAELSPEIYQPIIDYLASAEFLPKTIGAIAQRFPHLSHESLTEAIIVLLSLDYIAPCQSEEEIKASMKTARAFNIRVCQHAQFDDYVSYLASPVTNAGVYANKMTLLFCWAFFQEYDNPVQWVFDCMQTQNIHINQDHGGIQTETDRLSIIEQQHSVFVKDQLPLFKALGILH